MSERNLLSIEMQDLQEAIRELNQEKGWRAHAPGEAPKEGHEFPAYLALLHSEVTEMLEAYRDKVWTETCPANNNSRNNPPHIKGCSGKPHEAAKPIGVGPEAADVLIRLLDMCDLWGIDLAEETARVMQFGWTRSYRHGGRQL